MGILTEIGWCDSSVNPLVGCDGCELHRCGEKDSHCYAAGLVGRYKGLPGWPVTFDAPQHFAGRLEKAIRWADLTGKDRPEKPWLNGYPRLIFVCDLADPFTESVDPETWLTPMLPKMADSPHVYILLTKRGRRALEYWRRHDIPKNVWQGVTVTGPETIQRIDYLLQVPGASVRFVSLEPLLAPVYLGERVRRIDWVIVGAESGPKARKFDAGWVRSLREQCIRRHTTIMPNTATCAFFYKQDAAAGVKIPLPLLDGKRLTEMPRIA
jgi:protein gp37